MTHKKQDHSSKEQVVTQSQLVDPWALLRANARKISSGTTDDWRSFSATQENKKRKVGGWKAKKSGETAEDHVLHVGKIYLQKGIAELRKRPEPYRRIGSAQQNGQFTAAPLAKSGPDFDLALPDGRSGLVEVKSRKGKRIPIHAVGSAQADALSRRIDWNGFGVVIVTLWSDIDIRRWWVIDWREWSRAQADGLKSLSIQDLDQRGVQCDTIDVLGRPDWLPALLKADENARLQAQKK